MNSQFLFEKLESSEEYEKFMKENPKAYLCSGFFEISINNNSENKYHFDYYLPETGKTFSFQIEDGIKLIELERNSEEKVLEEVSMKNNFNFSEIKDMIVNEMENRKIGNKIQKMLFSLQKIDGKDSLLGTIFISGFGILKVMIILPEIKITEFEKKSLFDMVKFIGKKK